PNLVLSAKKVVARPWNRRPLPHCVEARVLSRPGAHAERSHGARIPPHKEAVNSSRSNVCNNGSRTGIVAFMPAEGDRRWNAAARLAAPRRGILDKSIVWTLTCAVVDHKTQVRQAPQAFQPLAQAQLHWTALNRFRGSERLRTDFR